MSALYLLVCEGFTDSLVIDKIAKKIGQTIGRSIEIRTIAPQRDATTGRTEDFGWENVRQWCELHGTSQNIEPHSLQALAASKKNWKPLISFSGASGLIIQIDTDIVEQIGDIRPPYSGSTKKARKNFMEKAIITWLGERDLPTEIFILASTHSTETWILATYDRSNGIFKDLDENFDFEDIKDVTKRLLELGYKCHPENEKKLNKHKDFYTDYANNITAKITKVRSECEEVEKLCRKLES
jgi:hypothetical protein